MGRLDENWASALDFRGYTERDVIVSPYAVKDGERLFPVSRHRSKRVEKKLIRRYGGIYAQIPAVWTTGDKIIVHPVLWHDLQRVIQRRDDDYRTIDITGFGHPYKRRMRI